MNISEITVEAPKANEMTVLDKAIVELTQFIDTEECVMFSGYKINYRNDLESIVITTEDNVILCASNDPDVLLNFIVELLGTIFEEGPEVLLLGSRKVNVNSLKEAQIIYIELREKYASNGGSCADFFQGWVSGYNISWNGSVWFEGDKVL